MQRVQSVHFQLGLTLNSKAKGTIRTVQLGLTLNSKAKGTIRTLQLGLTLNSKAQVQSVHFNKDEH